MPVKFIRWGGVFGIPERGVCVRVSVHVRGGKKVLVVGHTGRRRTHGRGGHGIRLCGGRAGVCEGEEQERTGVSNANRVSVPADETYRQ